MQPILALFRMSVEARDFLSELEDQAVLDLLASLLDETDPGRLILPPHPTGRRVSGLSPHPPEALKRAVGLLELALGKARVKPPAKLADSQAGNLTSIRVLLTAQEAEKYRGRSIPRGAQSATLDEVQEIPPDAAPVTVHCDPWTLNAMRDVAGGFSDLTRYVYRATFLRYAPESLGPGLGNATIRFRLSETLAMIAFDAANRDHAAWEDFWLPLAVEAMPDPYDANDHRIGVSFRATSTAERDRFRDKLEFVARLEGAIQRYCARKYPVKFPIHAALAEIKDPSFKARHRK